MSRQTTKRATSSSRTPTRAASSRAGTSSRSGGTRSGSRSGTARSTTSRQQTRRRSAPPPPPESHAREFWAIGLLVLALLTALGVWFESAGTLGVYLLLLFRGLFGVLGLFAPICLAAVGVCLLREQNPAHGRVAVGAAVTGAALGGLWHLAMGAPSFGAKPAALHRAAGWLGAAVALPLREIAATGGAIVLLLGLLSLGLLIM